jgi:NAD(P)-dependent dehydrogenase (short-subunit alcohol dehydrogenase family)/acyl carrier protein
VRLGPCKPRHLRASGHYLITGGLGALGLEVARHLSRSVRADLVLITRSPFPPESNWDEWISDHPAEDITSTRIQRLRELQSAGSRVLVIDADVSDAARMKTAVRLAKAKFGRIHGVVHAAGIAGGGLMQLRSTSEIMDVLAPKVEGTVVLANLFRSAGLDFFAAFSSLSSITGALGLVDYCAANSFLDAYAQACRHDGLNLVTINWNAWRGLGMAADRAVPGEFEGAAVEVEKNSLTPEQGIEAFTRILESGLTQVLVSTERPSNIAQRASSVRERSSNGVASRSKRARTKLAAAYVPPRTQTEQMVAELWQALLGIERVGITDNFFNLGGHSLMGTRLVARLQAAFGVPVPLRSLFEAPTVSALAALVDTKRLENEEEERARLLEMIRTLPEEAVEQELAKRTGAAR